MYWNHVVECNTRNNKCQKYWLQGNIEGKGMRRMSHEYLINKRKDDFTPYEARRHWTFLIRLTHTKGFHFLEMSKFYTDIDPISWGTPFLMGINTPQFTKSQSVFVQSSSVPFSSPLTPRILVRLMKSTYSAVLHQYIRSATPLRVNKASTPLRVLLSDEKCIIWRD